MTLILREIDQAVGCGYDFINNMVRYRQFRSELLPARASGKAREFTRDNALEVALRFAASRAGMRAGEVDAFSSEWRRRLVDVPGALFLAVNPVTGGYVTFTSDELSVRDLRLDLAREENDDQWTATLQAENTEASTPAAMITIIDLGKMVRAIDAALAQKAGVSDQPPSGPAGDSSSSAIA